MHRHGYKGRKLHREKDQRKALLRSLASSLIDNGSIETTLAKAKETLPYVEKLITRAKKSDLSSRRLVIAELHSKQSVNKLFDEISPKLNKRNGGHLRIERTRLRRGDNAQLARLSFVDDISEKTTSETVKVENKASDKKEPVKEAKK